jgi:probable phosphoglycerate mutase
MATAMRSIEAAFLVDGTGATLEGATEVWLVRHGDCYEGITDEDPPLSPQGREQARRLAERVGRLRVDAVYASPLRRALETACAITPDVRVDERLVEVHTDLDDGYVQPAEQLEQVLARMRAAVGEAVDANAGGRIVIVGHAMAILAYLCDVLRVEFGALRLLPYYTSVNIVRVLGERRMVGSLADVAHLEG